MFFSLYFFIGDGDRILGPTSFVLSLVDFFNIPLLLSYRGNLLFLDHMELFLSDKDLRFFIGVSHVESILADSKKKMKFEEGLRYLVRNIVKRNS